MKGKAKTITEYLLRTVRESELMKGWQDTFSKVRDDLSKELSKQEPETQKEAFEAEDAFDL